MSPLITVISIWCLAVITPGPNFFITARTATRYSRRASLLTVIGICSGTLLWAITGYLGISYLFIAAPWLYFSLKIIGGSYLIFLGFKILRRSNATIPGSDESIESPGMFSHCRRGLITNVSNPKTAMFISSLFAAVLPREPSLMMGLSCVLLIILISAIWYSLVAILFSTAWINTKYNQARRSIEVIAGTIFLAFGAKLIFNHN